MSTYSWLCHACDRSNPAHVSACIYCGFPSIADGIDIQQARRKLVQPRKAPPQEIAPHRAPPPLTLSQLSWIVVALWLLGLAPLLALSYFQPTISGLVSAGQFGDAFGAVNALFSGLAFAGVVYAIFLQRQDLALQRDELAKSSGAGIRQVHIALQQMAMRDHELQEVWGIDTTSTKKERKQHAYINLILSNWETLFANGSLTSTQINTTASRYMRGKAFQSFWKQAREYRAQMAAGGSDVTQQFHQLIDSAYLRATQDA